MTFTVRMGRWECCLTPRGLEAIALDGQPVLERVVHAVRALDWSTERAPLLYEADADRIAFRARYPVHGLELRGSIAEIPDGLAVEFVCEAIGGPVEIQRAGPCVLHWPPDGRLRRNPAIPATRRLEIGPVVVELEGGELETEDQRHWSDASFKSYTPPLSESPFWARPGEPIRHRLLITASQVPPPARGKWCASAGLGATGTMPALGLQHSGAAPPAAVEAIGRLRPAFLHLVAHLSLPDWRETLATDAALAQALDVPITLTMTARPDQCDLIREAVTILDGRLTTLLAFDTGDPHTSPELARAARAAVGPSVAVGGGSRGHLANLLEAPAPPVADLDVVAFPIHACAHDTDRAAARSSLASHAAMIASARSAADGRPLLIGPVGYLPDWNAWAPPPSEHAGWGEGLPRQRSVFTAAWAAAALAGFAAARVPAVSLFHTLGDRGVGVMSGDDFQPFPVFRLLCALAGTAGADVSIRGCPPERVEIGVGSLDVGARFLPAPCVVLNRRGAR